MNYKGVRLVKINEDIPILSIHGRPNGIKYANNEKCLFDLNCDLAIHNIRCEMSWYCWLIIKWVVW